MEISSSQGAAICFMVQSGYREWRAAQDKAMDVARQILGATGRVEVERLTQQLEVMQRDCFGPWSRFISATHAYADALILVPAAGIGDDHES
jgi:hypothetical protein